MTTEATTGSEGVVEPSASESVETPEVTEGELEISEEPSGETLESEGQEELAEESAEEPSETDKYEVTVDGQKLLLTRDELMKGFQLGAASHKRFQEAAQARKEAEAALSKIKENPLEAFLQAGGDQKAFRALVEDFLIKEIEYDKLSPEERELNDLRRYKEEQEIARQEEAKRRQQEVQNQETEMYQKQFTEQYNKALTDAGLPVSEKAIQFIAKTQLDALEAGYEMPLDLAIQYYREEQSNSVNNYLSSLPVDQLVGIIGKDRMKEIRKQELAGLKNPVSRKKSAPAAPASSADEKMTASEFFASLR